MPICLSLSASLSQIPSVLTDKKLRCLIPNSSSKFSEDFIDIDTNGFPIVVPNIPIIVVITNGNKRILIADLPELLVIISSLLFVRLKKQVKLPNIIISGKVSSMCNGDLIIAFCKPTIKLWPCDDILTIWSEPSTNKIKKNIARNDQKKLNKYFNPM